MKGTLFSTDFVKDSNGNLRLLEINTDTAIVSSAIKQLDFTGFKQVLESNSITKVKTIHKLYQEDIVEALKAYLDANVPSVNSFESIVEDSNTIYPTSVEDAADTFILRLAYDEAALLDSEYAKNTHNILKLFSDNGQISSTVGYYYAGGGSIEDHLTRDFNAENVPDILVKNLNTTLGEPIEFFKIGQSSKTAEDRFADVFDMLDDTKIAMNFYNDEAAAKVESFRTLHIVYGSDLNVIDVAGFKSSAILDKPASLSVVDEDIVTKVDVKHYHELTTTLPRFGVGSNYGGIFEEEFIVKADGTLVPIKDATVGDSFKSYFISGSPDTDIESEYLAWTYPGSELPSGSYATTSTLVNNLEVGLFYNMIFHVTLQDGSDFRATGNSHVLVYDVQADLLKYVAVNYLSSDKHKLISAGNGLVDITGVVCEILDGEYSSHILDMEIADTFFIGDGQLSVKIVAHNCFPAGTKITMADGSVKNIEDVKAGDKLLTINENTLEQSEGRVGDVLVKKDRLLFEFKLEDGGVIKSTSHHRYFVKEKSWLTAQDIQVGDVLVRSNGDDVKVESIEQHEGEFEVFHIIDVKDNHTYYAEDILVHNYKACFIAGTEITLANGDVKNIEDVAVGEEVLTYNEDKKETEAGVVGDLKKHEVQSVIRLTLDNENVIVTTEEHPFYVVDAGWVKAGELQPLDVCLKEDGKESLISSVEVLEEKHEVFNLLSVSENHNFFANGILVHNKK
jgi:hypothetical protein